MLQETERLIKDPSAYPGLCILDAKPPLEHTNFDHCLIIE